MAAIGAKGMPALAQAPPHHRQGVHQGDGHQPQGGDRRQAVGRLTGLNQAPDDQIAQEHTAGIAEKDLAPARSEVQVAHQIRHQGGHGANQHQEQGRSRRQEQQQAAKGDQGHPPGQAVDAIDHVDGIDQPHHRHQGEGHRPGPQGQGTAAQHIPQAGDDHPAAQGQ